MVRRLKYSGACKVSKVKYTSICIAHRRNYLLMFSDIDLITVLLANYTMPAFTLQPQSITTFWLVLNTHFTVSRRVEGWVDLGGWLHTEIKCRLRESNPDTVTHPSTNRAQRSLASLIETNVLPLRQTTTHPEICYNDTKTAVCMCKIKLKFRFMML